MRILTRVNEKRIHTNIDMNWNECESVCKWFNKNDREYDQAGANQYEYFFLLNGHFDIELKLSRTVWKEKNTK